MVVRISLTDPTNTVIPRYQKYLVDVLFHYKYYIYIFKAILTMCD